MNIVALVGYLASDPEQRYTQSSTEVSNFRIAVNRNFKNSNGEQEADFINCVAWRKIAEVINKYGHKGMRAGINGRIQTRNYENNDGRTVYITEIVVENFEMLQSKNETTQYTNTSQTQAYNQKSGTNFNNKNTQSGEDPFESNNDSIDISDDDLPF